MCGGGGGGGNRRGEDSLSIFCGKDQSHYDTVESKALRQNILKQFWRKQCYDRKLKGLKGKQNVAQGSVCFQIVVMTVLERKLVSGAWRMGTIVKRLIWRMTALLPVDTAVSANPLYLYFPVSMILCNGQKQKKVALI